MHVMLLPVACRLFSSSTTAVNVRTQVATNANMYAQTGRSDVFEDNWVQLKSYFHHLPNFCFPSARVSSIPDSDSGGVLIGIELAGVGFSPSHVPRMCIVLTCAISGSKHLRGSWHAMPMKCGSNGIFFCCYVPPKANHTKGYDLTNLTATADQALSLFTSQMERFCGTTVEGRP